jgi:hypothetical protein
MLVKQKKAGYANRNNNQATGDVDDDQLYVMKV